MSKSNRRVFLLQAGACGTAVFAPLQARAADAILSESDPAAIAQGYKADGSKVDRAKYPKYEPAQDCGGCQLFESIPGGTEPYGHCQLFEGRRVAVKGWCNSWV